MFTCRTADQWTALFDRAGLHNTWLGADGIYSIPLNCPDTLWSADAHTRTLFIFSDTIIGSADCSGCISDGSMPNHTAALLEGNLPHPESITFLYGKNGSCTDRGNLFGEDQWLFDGFCHGESVGLFAFCHDAAWKPCRIDLLTLPLVDGRPDFAQVHRTRDIPQLLHTTADHQYAFGMGLLQEEGWLYLYGYRDHLHQGSRKDLIAARIPLASLPDFGQIEYFTESGWGSDITQCACLLPAVSCEMSVTPLPDGRYIAIYTENVQTARVMAALGSSPVGPFDRPICCYIAPESRTAPLGGDGVRYTYNAKAHPHLSSPDTLLISYNVNVLRNGFAQNTADYRPRFITLPLEKIGNFPVS